MEVRSGIGDMGDLYVLFLSLTLAAVRDRLYADGFGRSADLLQTFVMQCDDYMRQLFGEEG